MCSTLTGGEQVADSSPSPRPDRFRADMEVYSIAEKRFGDPFGLLFPLDGHLDAPKFMNTRPSPDRNPGICGSDIGVNGFLGGTPPNFPFYTCR